MPPMQMGCWNQEACVCDFEMRTNPDVVRIPTSALLFRENGLQVGSSATRTTKSSLSRSHSGESRHRGRVLKGLTLTDRRGE